MSYFKELSNNATYANDPADFHFVYNSNSGGGQSFLAGKFYNQDGQLVSPDSLDGKTGILRIVYTVNDSENIVTINDPKAEYDIKPRGNGSTSMKLGIGNNRIAPSKVIATFMMLPSTCGVKSPGNLDYSILSIGNYWLQSMWLICETDSTNSNEIFLVPKDYIFCGGVTKDSTGDNPRYFSLDANRRISDIIALSNSENGFPDPIQETLKYFSDIYTGQEQFDYDQCDEKIKTLMSQLASFCPDRYSGISDPLPILRLLSTEWQVQNNAVRFYTGLNVELARNRILFGAPGTGKSYTLNEETKDLIGDGNEDDYERVTFHPDYSYANFVGTYKPVPIKDNHGNDSITYAYVPGPFMRVYVQALKNSRTDAIRPFLLIIEEINRANVAAVFGDIFQLLDRGDDEVSEYPIQASEDIKAYLAKELGGNPEDYAKIRIPDNMFIWATMNSADQGVFPMDTAFKRRWDFTYLGIDDSDEKIRGKYVYLADDKSQKVEWNKLRKAINHFLAKEKINEDKQLGPYFISRSIVVPTVGDEIDRDHFIRVFKNKVIMYLFEDAAKQKRAKLFEGCFQDSTRYSEICREFDSKGIGIFNHEIQLETEPEEPQWAPTEDEN